MFRFKKEKKKKNVSEVLLENKNPTITEKELFLYGGFYRDVRMCTDNLIVYRSCYKAKIYEEDEDGFPLQFDAILADEEIRFYRGSETIEITSWFDYVILGLIKDRCEELRWDTHMIIRQ